MVQSQGCRHIESVFAVLNRKNWRSCFAARSLFCRRFRWHLMAFGLCPEWQRMTAQSATAEWQVVFVIKCHLATNGSVCHSLSFNAIKTKKPKARSLAFLFYNFASSRLTAGIFKTSKIACAGSILQAPTAIFVKSPGVTARRRRSRARIPAFAIFSGFIIKPMALSHLRCFSSRD